MPSECGFTWSDSLDNLIILKSVQYGVPLDLSYAFIAAESGFDPSKPGDCTDPTNLSTCCSWGLLQLNLCGGQGTGFTPAQLQDAATNLDIGLPPIAAAFRLCWTPTIAQDQYIRCVMRNSGHPGNVPDGDPVFEAAFNNIFPKWQCFFNALVTSISTGDIAPSPVITTNPAALNPAPFFLPVIAPFQPGQPLLGSQPSTGMDIGPLIVLAGLVGVAALFGYEEVTKKKIIIKYPSGPVNISRYSGK